MRNITEDSLNSFLLFVDEAQVGTGILPRPSLRVRALRDDVETPLIIGAEAADEEERLDSLMEAFRGIEAA